MSAGAALAAAAIPSPGWGLPFAGLLLSVALLPTLAPRWWHRFDNAVILAWALAYAIPALALHGPSALGAELVHTLLAEYLPFVLLLSALYVVSGGIYLHTTVEGTPAANCGFLLAGALLASVMGTTGASMLLVRPLLRANRRRAHRVHQLVFFIFIVANIGGALSPLGDPPLFLGYLAGVDFFWTTWHLLGPTVFAAGACLGTFYVIDRILYARESKQGAPVSVEKLDDHPTARFEFRGAGNLVLLAAIVAFVLAGAWDGGKAFELAGTAFGVASVVQCAGLLLVAWVSWRHTPRRLHELNGVTWWPMIEVAVLFAGIFITITPVLAMLKAGEAGPLAPLVGLVHGADGEPSAWRYFWLTGALSSMLDNAPTYLAFFNMAGGHAQTLMSDEPAVLAAISAGAVFMGALTYIGNAPNLMVRGVARAGGVTMPGFFGFMGWSLAALLPVFVAVGLIWF